MITETERGTCLDSIRNQRISMHAFMRCQHFCSNNAAWPSIMFPKWGAAGVFRVTRKRYKQYRLACNLRFWGFSDILKHFVHNNYHTWHMPLEACTKSPFMSKYNKPNQPCGKNSTLEFPFGMVLVQEVGRSM